MAVYIWGCPVMLIVAASAEAAEDLARVLRVPRQQWRRVVDEQDVLAAQPENDVVFDLPESGFHADYGELIAAALLRRLRVYQLRQLRGE